MYIYIYIYIYICLYIYLYMYVYTCTSTFTYIHIYTCTYIHIHVSAGCWGCAGWLRRGGRKGCLGRALLDFSGSLGHGKARWSFSQKPRKGHGPRQAASTGHKLRLRLLVSCLVALDGLSTRKGFKQHSAGPGGGFSEIRAAFTWKTHQTAIWQMQLGPAGAPRPGLRPGGLGGLMSPLPFAVLQHVTSVRTHTCYVTPGLHSQGK